MFIQNHIYHLTHADNLPSIQRHGLLSAQALLDLAGADKEEQQRINQHQRPTSLALPNGTLLNDQKPMPSSALERCLHGMTPAQWYTLLNSKVFFWFDIERLNRLRKVLLTTPQIVLIVDTQRLLARYSDSVSLSPINTGNARRQPALRGLSTFVPYTTWLQSGWASEANTLGTRSRPKSHQPVELTVTGSVPDIMDFVIDIHKLEPMEILDMSQLYQKSL
ncbi:MAG: DUF4433 domain-containing protein [Ktedonobacteraceae bacterium]|nr:DUF4433 domain-containing protein [Ktedonobacteraceae bacterium]